MQDLPFPAAVGLLVLSLVTGGLAANEAVTRDRVAAPGPPEPASYGEPDHGGSQFFVVHRDSPIDPRHTIFGRVVGGTGVIDGIVAGGIAKGPNDGFDGRPAIEARIRDVATS